MGTFIQPTRIFFVCLLTCLCVFPAFITLQSRTSFYGSKGLICVTLSCVPGGLCLGLAFSRCSCCFVFNLTLPGITLEEGNSTEEFP